MKDLRLGLSLDVLVHGGGCCATYSGYGRYAMEVGCDVVEIAGVTYQLERSGSDLTVGGRSLQRGINRDARPWLYLHEDQGGRGDITFDEGSKDIYPLYTGVSASIFGVYDHAWEMTRSTNAAFSENYWLVSHRWAADAIYFDLEQRTGDVTQWRLARADIRVPGDGTEVTVQEISTSVKILSFDPVQRVAMVQFLPLLPPRIPVVFVHGHSGSAQVAWQSPGGTGTTSFAAALAANPGLPIDPFYLNLPLHDGTQNLDRPMEDDATDILAAIEGGPDSSGNVQVGILNRPEYQGVSRVSIVAYSQGAMSSRYYIKHLMGSRHANAITVREFITLAAPNHGVSRADGLALCGTALNPDVQDRSQRQLCGGMRATPLSEIAPCGSCGLAAPDPFGNNSGTDLTFLVDLNGHPLGDSCGTSMPQHPELEAPSSRPTTPNGILYVNLYAANNGDTFGGGGTHSGDCVGRRLALNHAPDVANGEISGVPGFVHAEFPHHWPTICVALRSIVDHQAPQDQTTACQGLVHP
jgi:hypothetical protein